MSPRKSRKPLADALAQQFIYGEKQQGSDQEPSSEEIPSELPPEQPSPNDEETPNTSPLMDKFQTPPKEATVRFTVDLPASMHRKLSILAARTGKKKAEIVRVLLDEALKDVNA
ncbi:MAG TPA: hypothetical protein V6C90_10625 [Coleofasciculaceae cyanobacterium]|jgi:hypothetical protein